MGRNRGRSGLDALAALPWPVGFAIGIAGFIAVRYGFVWWMSRHGGLLAQAFQQQNGATLAPLAWLVLAACWIAALMSFLGSRHRCRLLDTRTDLESLAAGGPYQFERLVGEAFRRQGYAVEETGLGGADGGIDLILRKDSRRTLVQCKHWKRQQVGVSVVRGRPACSPTTRPTP
jgi:restriction system protein